eukprot:4585683-Amphidinium_carterae.2
MLHSKKLNEQTMSAWTAKDMQRLSDSSGQTKFSLGRHSSSRSATPVIRAMATGDKPPILSSGEALLLSVSLHEPAAAAK